MESRPFDRSQWLQLFEFLCPHPCGAEYYEHAIWVQILRCSKPLEIASYFPMLAWEYCLKGLWHNITSTLQIETTSYHRLKCYFKFVSVYILSTLCVAVIHPKTPKSKKTMLGSSRTTFCNFNPVQAMDSPQTTMINIFLALSGGSRVSKWSPFDATTFRKEQEKTPTYTPTCRGWGKVCLPCTMHCP